MSQFEWPGVFSALTTKFTADGSARPRAPRLQLPDARAAEIEAILSGALESRPSL